MSTESNRPDGLAGAASSALDRAFLYRRAHVRAIYAGRMPTAPRQGWAVCDPFLMREAPHLAFDRGDGWSLLTNACLYPEREMAEAYAATWRGSPPEVVFCRHEAESPNTKLTDSSGQKP